MRSLYKGIIGFGLVSIPIQVFRAMESERVTTHWIHATCHTRIRQQKFCPTCERPVASDEVVTGAPLPDGRYVVLDNPEKSGANPDHVITILNFPELQEVDPVFYDSAYWLKPGPGGQTAYALLTQAMRELGRVALAKMQLRSRSSLAIVRPFNERTLMLHRMFYPESLRKEGEQFGLSNTTWPEKELKMAENLVQYMAEPFSPEKYPNQERLQRLQQIEKLMPSAWAPQEAGREAQDLMQRLKASVEAQTRHGQAGGRRDA